MRFWWVNQNQTYRQEQSGNFMWSPKRKADGHRHHFYDTMRVVAPGDVVLSFRDGRIGSIGTARSYCYESPKPLDFGSAGLNWEAVGWRVDVHWNLLQHSVKPADHIGALRPTLPLKYAPIRAQNGHGLQSVYLTEIPETMMRVLARLIGYEALALLDAAPQPIQSRVAERPEHEIKLRSDWEDNIERKIVDNQNIKNTQRTALIRARVGQGQFRYNVRQVEKACRVTQVENPEHLIASHCKPWRYADNLERLDGENGLMLTPTIDHLFDRGFISFEDSGRLLISPVADRGAMERMGIDVHASVNVGSFSEGQRKYLNFHRNDIFLEVRGT
jgi:putative restriction endonuclease